MTRHTIRSFALVLVAVLAGCSSVGGQRAAEPEPTGPNYPEIGGAWMGSLMIEGEGFNTMLDVEQADADLRVTVEIPMLDLVTTGSGTVLPDGTLRVSFAYELECPGSADYIGEVSSDGAVLEGTVLASDCTGDLRGTFRYAREG